MTIEKLFSIETDEDLGKLGFESQGMLVDQEGFENYYERLWIWHNEKLKIDVMTHDIGNGWCDVVSIKKAVDEWIKPLNLLRKRLKNGLHLLIESHSDKEWDFNLWEPDEKNPKEYGLFYSGGTYSKLDYPEIEDVYVRIKKDYDRK
jgi:hypothetical protein